MREIKLVKGRKVHEILILILFVKYSCVLVETEYDKGKIL